MVGLRRKPHLIWKILWRIIALRIFIRQVIGKGIVGIGVLFRRIVFGGWDGRAWQRLGLHPARLP